MPKILVIDDEPVVCDVLVEYLGELPDTEVHCARSGVEGAEKLQNERFDLALIDCLLPEISGLKLATLAANENIPVLFISGDPETNNKLERFGHTYLTKPFSLDQLRAELKRVIAETSANIARVKASADQLLAKTETLKTVIAESQRLLEERKRIRGATQGDRPLSHP
jgi:DNA-binding response OmpR family regulator